MPHQRLVLDVGLEVEPATGTFAYRDVTVTEPRQSGKSSKLLSLAVWRCALWARDAGRGRSRYSAQPGLDARRKMLDDWLPVLEELRTARAGARRAHGVGARSVHVRGRLHDRAHREHARLRARQGAGSRRWSMRRSTTRTTGASRRWCRRWRHARRGATVGHVDRGHRGCVLPAPESRDRPGARRARRDAGRRGYFEWSAPDDTDLDDEATWPTFMPALDRIVNIDAVRHAHTTMTPAEFARAFANRWTRTDDAVIPLHAWLACRDVDASPGPGAITLAVDAPPERTTAVIVAADAGLAVELVDRRAGQAWVAERLRQLRERHDVRSIVLHGAGPAGTLAVELERNFGGDVVIASDTDMTLAAGTFYDAVMAGRLEPARRSCSTTRWRAPGSAAAATRSRGPGAARAPTCRRWWRRRSRCGGRRLPMTARCGCSDDGRTERRICASATPDHGPMARVRLRARLLGTLRGILRNDRRRARTDRRIGARPMTLVLPGSPEYDDAARACRASTARPCRFPSEAPSRAPRTDHYGTMNIWPWLLDPSRPAGRPGRGLAGRHRAHGDRHPRGVALHDVHRERGRELSRRRSSSTPTAVPRRAAVAVVERPWAMLGAHEFWAQAYASALLYGNFVGVNIDIDPRHAATRVRSCRCTRPTCS